MGQCLKIHVCSGTFCQTIADIGAKFWRIKLNLGGGAVASEASVYKGGVCGVIPP